MLSQTIEKRYEARSWQSMTKANILKGRKLQVDPVVKDYLRFNF